MIQTMSPVTPNPTIAASNSLSPVTAPPLVNGKGSENPTNQYTTSAIATIDRMPVAINPL